MPTVIVQNWMERERGWGPRDDGFTVHPDRAHRDAYVAWYNKTYNNREVVPDDYTTTSGEAFLVETTAALRKRVVSLSRDGRNAASDQMRAVWGVGRYFNPTATLEAKHLPAPKAPAKPAPKKKAR